MTTESVSAAPAMRATANIVGNTFVNKYYNVLHLSPEMVHRFYTNRSILSRAETGPSGRIDISVSQEGINQKIMSLDYRDFRAEIKTVDSLESLNGSVLVMVTGALSTRGHAKRNFVQTFFLAPQEVGYFVLNDMFRYLDGEPEPLQPPVALATNGTIGQQLPQPLQGDIDSQVPPQQEAREYSDPPAGEDIPATISEGHILEEREGPKNLEEEEEHTGIKEGVKEEASVVAVSHEEVDISVPRDEEVLHSAEEQNQEDAPKKSYASILRVRSGASGSSSGAKAKHIQAQRKSLSPSSSTSPAIQPTPAIAPSVTSEYATSITSTEGVQGDAISEHEGDGNSIYVKNLPLNITVSELDIEFKKFGTIKSGGINLRNQRIGVCFAFIEYEEANAAQTAIEASPIAINGRQVYIEEKKPMPMAPRAGRGRFTQGRGYQQNDGSRGGRGYYGGRGFPRQGLDAEGGRGQSYAHYTPNFNNVNGYRRTDTTNNNSSSWNGPRPVRRGAGNQGGTHGRVSAPLEK